MTDPIQREHFYHAEGTVLSGNLSLPLAQEIKPQAYAKLHERGGYLSEHAHDYRLEGAISFRAAYTQVAGNLDPKAGHGWSTLATSVIEGLNVLDVVTADRVVAQISADHPLSGYVPSVTLLGTRFENLRISGHPVTLDLDPHLLGPKPDGDAPYTSDPGFRQRVTSQYQRIQGSKGLPAEVLARYNQLPASPENQESIECSLVNQASGSYPGQSCGHVIDIPNFGTIYLATLRLEQSDFQHGVPKQTLIKLTMIEFKLGCLANGTAQAADAVVNGHTKP